LNGIRFHPYFFFHRAPHQFDITMAVFSINALPREVLEQCFNWVDDGTFLVNVVSVVCKMWRNVLGPHDSPYWNSRAAFYNQLPPAGTVTTCWDIRHLAVFAPFHRNIAGATPSIVRDEGTRLVSGWLCNGISDNWDHGDRWAIETGEDGTRVVASTYKRCNLRRLFELRKMLSQNVRPNDAGLVAVDIKCDLEVSTRFDCGGYVAVELADGPDHQGGRRLPPHTSLRLSLSPSTPWEWCTFEARGVFAPPSGNVVLTIVCKDDRNWAGHYGPKIRQVNVELAPSKTCMDKASITAKRSTSATQHIAYREWFDFEQSM